MFGCQGFFYYHLLLSIRPNHNHIVLYNISILPFIQGNPIWQCGAPVREPEPFTQVELLQDCSPSSLEKLFKSRYKRASKSTDFSMHLSKRSLVSFKEDSILFSFEVLKGQEGQWSLMVAGHEAASGDRRMGRLCTGMGGNKVDIPLLPQNQRSPFQHHWHLTQNFSKQGIPIPHPDTPKVNGTFRSEETEAQLLKGKLQLPGTCRLGCQEAEGTVGLGEDFKTRVSFSNQARDFLHLLYPARE